MTKEEKALAVIGQAAMDEAGCNHDRLEQLFDMAARLAPDNATLSALTKLFEDAGEDRGWMMRRHAERKKRNEVQ